MIRRILIIFCFVNIILYYCAFAFFDNITGALAKYNMPEGLLNFLQFFIVLSLGFLIGFLIILSVRIKVFRNYFDLKVLLMAGLIPILALLLYKTGLVNLIVVKVFDSNKTVSEAVFYFFFDDKDMDFVAWHSYRSVSQAENARSKEVQAPGR